MSSKFLIYFITFKNSYSSFQGTHLFASDYSLLEQYQAALASKDTQTGAQTAVFQGKGGFVELGHLDKHKMAHKKKVGLFSPRYS